MEKRSYTIALAGQPNVGKSTVFNLITGMNQHVGNWPGKTIEQKVGTFKFNGTEYKLVDLPGTYSLTANSAEELVTREFIIGERPDVVVALLDAALLERSLYLIAELLPLPSPVIIALNMMDVAEHEGLTIEPDVLEAALGACVVPMVATKNIGTRELVEAIDDLAKHSEDYAPKLPEIRSDHQHVLEGIEALVDGQVPEPYPQSWVALKLLEGDKELTHLMREQLDEPTWDSVHDILRAHDDALVAVAGGRYEWIERMVRAAVTNRTPGLISVTERIDRWATAPFRGLLLLAVILGATFWLTFSVGAPIQEWIDGVVVGRLSEWASSAMAGAPFWLRGLVVDGAIAGVGTVLSFLPILIIFFAILGLLEDTGYMARAAYVMDGFMHLMGLHGKSFLPLFLGFGCNVPAIMGARVIDSRRARLLTITLAPLIPCAARMSVVAFLAPSFFGRGAALVSWGLVMLNLIILALTGIVLNRTVFKGERAAFIMELPLYHAPNARTIGLAVWRNTVAFLKKAASVILVISLMVYALSVIPGGSIETSILARVGRWMEPIGRPLGFDWRLMVALVTSLVAKENSIATLGVLFGGGNPEIAGGAQGALGAAMAATYPPAVGLSFLAVQMLFIPCVATIAATRQETKSWAWTLFDSALLVVISFAAGTIIYQIARLVW